jgi:hypothetical protein
MTIPTLRSFSLPSSSFTGDFAHAAFCSPPSGNGLSITLPSALTTSTFMPLTGNISPGFTTRCSNFPFASTF